MGARLSQPRGPAGTTESSRAHAAPPPPTPARPFPRTINRRTVVAPLAAFTMACILFVYARTSIRAAKAHAQRHRDVDSGGEGLSLLQESRRRHGLEAPVQGTQGGTVGLLVGEMKGQIVGAAAAARAGRDGGEGKKGSKIEEEDRSQLLKGAGRRGGREG